MNKDASRIHTLDTLRGVASLSIALVWHYTHFGAASFPIQHLTWFQLHSYILVDFFFILSGMVFMHVYRTRILNKTITFEKYIVFRISRLYPIHVITLFAAAIGQYFFFSLNGVFFVYSSNDVFHFILNLLFLQGGMFETSYSFNGPSWSIAVEVIGYMLFFYILNKYGKSRSHYLTAFIIVILVGLTLQKQAIEFVLFNHLTARLFIGFFVGCLLYELSTTLQTSRHKVLILTLIFVLLAFFIKLYLEADPTLVGHINNYTLFVFPSIIILCLHVKPMNFLLSTPPLTFLGNISFSVYLWHFPIQLLIKNLDPRLHLNIDYSSLSFFLSYASIVLIISFISYYIIELPIQGYIRKRYQEMSDKRAISISDSLE